MAHSQLDRMSGDVAPAYVRHKPEQTLLYQLVEQYWPECQAQLNETGRFLPRHVTREFEDYLACGRLENGFLRVRCQSCSHEHLVAFSCKRRGFCTSCGARRMVETAALLVDHVLPHRPVRQWVLSFPYPLRFLLASQPYADTFNMRSECRRACPRQALERTSLCISTVWSMMRSENRFLKTALHTA